jgi:hypothetical protein
MLTKDQEYAGHHNVKFYVKLVYNAHCFAKDHKFLMIRAYHHPSQPSYELWKHDISVGSVFGEK